MKKLFLSAFFIASFLMPLVTELNASAGSALEDVSDGEGGAAAGSSSRVTTATPMADMTSDELEKQTGMALGVQDLARQLLEKEYLETLSETGTVIEQIFRVRCPRAHRKNAAQERSLVQKELEREIIFNVFRTVVQPIFKEKVLPGLLGSHAMAEKASGSFYYLNRYVDHKNVLYPPNNPQDYVFGASETSLVVRSKSLTQYETRNLNKYSENWQRVIDAEFKTCVHDITGRSYEAWEAYVAKLISEL